MDIKPSIIHDEFGIHDSDGAFDVVFPRAQVTGEERNVISQWLLDNVPSGQFCHFRAISGARKSWSLRVTDYPTAALVWMRWSNGWNKTDV